MSIDGGIQAALQAAREAARRAAEAAAKAAAAAAAAAAAKEAAAARAQAAEAAKAAAQGVSNQEATVERREDAATVAREGDTNLARAMRNDERMGDYGDAPWAARDLRHGLLVIAAVLVAITLVAGIGFLIFWLLVAHLDFSGIS